MAMMFALMKSMRLMGDHDSQVLRRFKREVSNEDLVDSMQNQTMENMDPEPTWAWACMSVVNVGVIVLNLLIIIHVIKEKNFQKSSFAKYFVLSLAISDLFVGVVVMPTGIVASIQNTWTFGSMWCEVWQTLDFFACTASILNLVTISIDR